jgi:hypothetical protein
MVAAKAKKKSRRAKNARMPKRVADGTGRFAPHQPEDDNRQLVANMAAFGIDQDTIAKIIGVSHGTLTTHYRHELSVGQAQLIAAVAGRLAKSALAGDTTAAIFILKTRGGWSEKVQIEDMRDANLTIVLNAAGMKMNGHAPQSIKVGHDVLTLEHQPHRPNGAADGDNK